MRIDSVQLENVKSYEDATAAFSNGVNAICGRNGAGKSTVLEAIGFALFDYLQVTQAEFIRQNEKTATVTVNLSDGARKFRVIRACGSAPRYQVYDDYVRVADGKAECMVFLRDLFGISKNESLDAVFRDAVGVPQGLLTAAFLESPGTRKSIFDPLLHVDEYETAWKNLREAERLLKDQIGDIERRISKLSAIVGPLNETRDELSRVEGEQDERLAELAALDSQEEEVKSDVSALEARQLEIDAVSKEIEGAEKEIEKLEVESKTVSEALEDAFASLRIVERHTDDHEAFESLSAELETLQDKKDALQEALREQDVVRERIATFEERVRDLEQQLAQARTAAEEADALSVDVQAYQLGQTELQALRGKREFLSFAVRRHEDARKALDEAVKQLVTAESNAKEAQGLRGYITQLEKDIANLEERKEQVTGTGLRLKAEIERLEERMAKLGDADQCPLCGTELDDAHRRRIIDEAAAEMVDNQAAQSASREEWHEVSDQLKTFKEDLEKRRQRMARLENSVSVEEAEKIVLEKRKELAEAEDRVASVDDLDSQIATLEKSLADLGDPVTKQADLLALARREEGLERAFDDAGKQLSASHARLLEIKASLSGNEDIDARIAETKEELEAHREGNSLYAAHLQNAQKVERLVTRDGELTYLLSQQQELLDEAKNRSFTLRQGYDENDLISAKALLNDIAVRRATLQEGVRITEERLERLNRSIVEMEKESKQLTRVTEKQAEMERQLAHLGFLRQTIREAGPEITKMLVASISITADRLFCDIVKEPTAHLEWDEGYDIVVSMDGQERRFSQLSGGEQMSAALAVRLALLREISNVDIAFFDEPTVNLDVRRRESLAEQILSVKGFSQLFVISHDDSFETGTDNVVRIDKVDGASVIL